MDWWGRENLPPSTEGAGHACALGLGSLHARHTTGGRRALLGCSAEGLLVGLQVGGVESLFV